MPYRLATITSARLLMLPKRLCEQLGITRGDKLAVTIEDGAIILSPMHSQIEVVAEILDKERGIDANISR